MLQAVASDAGLALVALIGVVICGLAAAKRNGRAKRVTD